MLAFPFHESPCSGFEVGVGVRMGVLVGEEVGVFVAVCVGVDVKVGVLVGVLLGTTVLVGSGVAVGFFLPFPLGSVVLTEGAVKKAESTDVGVGSFGARFSDAESESVRRKTGIKTPRIRNDTRRNILANSVIELAPPYTETLIARSTARGGFRR